MTCHLLHDLLQLPEEISMDVIPKPKHVCLEFIMRMSTSPPEGVLAYTAQTNSDTTVVHQSAGF